MTREVSRMAQFKVAAKDTRHSRQPDSARVKSGWQRISRRLLRTSRSISLTYLSEGIETDRES
jgi:hypothetical protein